MDPVAPRRGFDVVAYLKLFRFPLVFTAIADSATGYLLVARDWAKPGVMAFLAVASAGLYCFGMAMNDIADAKRDKEIAPNRVIPSGRISLSGAWTAALGVLAVSLGAAVMAGRSLVLHQTLIAWVLIALAIVTYDFFLKLPPVMGLVRMGNVLLGVSTGSLVGFGDGYTAPLWVCIVLALPEFVYVTALTFVSTLEEGDLDRRRLIAGVSAMIVAAAAASFWMPLVSVVESFIRGMSASHSWIRPSWLGLLAAGILAGWLVYRARKALDRKGVMLLIRDGIGGIVLLNISLYLSFQNGDWKVALLLGSLLIPAAISVMIFKRLA